MLRNQLYSAAGITAWTQTVKQAEEAEIIRAKEMMQKELAGFPRGQNIEVISDIREGDPVHEILKEQEEKRRRLNCNAVIPENGVCETDIGMYQKRSWRTQKAPCCLYVTSRRGT